MSKLSDSRLLCFDVYGTLIDWETGILAAFQPALDKNTGAEITKKAFLTVFQSLEHEQQTSTPDLPYTELLATIHPRVIAKLGLPAPTAEESRAFGNSVGSWPAFPDTVDALQRLSKHYKLTVLSNVDRGSFNTTNAGPLSGVHFDLILTAQDIGSYKPDLRNFDYMLAEVKSRFGYEKEDVIQTAQSQFHDHYPASKKGIRSAYIARPGAIMGNTAEEIYDWKFDTLGDMAAALEKALA